MKLNHLAIIMDGNRRWAYRRSLTPLAGHNEGCNRLKDIVDQVLKYNITHLTVFAFSAENWKRSGNEIKGLIKLMRHFITQNTDIFIKKDIKLVIIGNRQAFDQDLQDQFISAEDKTKNCKKLVLTVALNYGGQQDIEQAAEIFAQEKQQKQENPHDPQDQKPFSAYLQTAHLPDVDMLIRTGGEKRLSNFVLWDISYAELYFTDIFWPDFSSDQLDKAIHSFYARGRRFGGDDIENITAETVELGEKTA